MRSFAAMSALVLVLVDSDATSAVAGDSASPAQLLAERGLTRSGRYYLLDEEPGFLAYSEANEAFTAHQAAQVELVAANRVAQSIREANNQLLLLRQQNDVCSEHQSRLSAKNTHRLFHNWNSADQAEHHRLRNVKLANNDSIRKIEQFLHENRPLRPDEGKMRQLASQADYARDELSARVSNAAQVMGQVVRDYESLGKEPEIVEALDALSEGTGGKLRLGPSEKFVDTYRKLGLSRKSLGRTPKEADQGNSLANPSLDDARRAMKLAAALEKVNPGAAADRYRGTAPGDGPRRPGGRTDQTARREFQMID
jgi:hypothetical protein